MFPTASNVVKVDDTFYVTYQLDAAHDLDSFQWKMTYDPEKLECTGVATPGVEEFVTINAETGKVRAAASNATNPFEFKFGDTFATFTFKALEAGEDGLRFHKTIFPRAYSALAERGAVMVEHGYLQGEQVRSLCEEAGFKRIITLKDYGGNDRVTAGFKDAG